MKICIKYANSISLTKSMEGTFVIFIFYIYMLCSFNPYSSFCLSIPIALILHHFGRLFYIIIIFPLPETCLNTSTYVECAFNSSTIWRFKISVQKYTQVKSFLFFFFSFLFGIFKWCCLVRNWFKNWRA